MKWNNCAENGFSLPISNTLHIRKSFNNGMKSKLNTAELFWRMVHFLLLACYCWLFKYPFYFINGNWVIIYHVEKLLEIRDHLSQRHGYFLSGQDRKTMLKWSFRELWMIKSLLLVSFKKLCAVFSYFTQKKKKKKKVRMSLSKHGC